MVDKSSSTSKNKPRKRIPKRILIPILIALSLQFSGPVTISDFPQLFEGKLIDYFNITTQGVQAMYSVTGLVGLVLDPTFGFIIQSIGFGFSCITFQFFTLIGIAALAVAVSHSSFLMFVVSRFLIGVALDALWVWQAPACEKWFSESYMTLALSSSLILGALVTSITTYYMPIIYVNTGNIILSVLFAGSICLVCFIGSFVFTYYDKRYEHLVEIEGLEDVDKSNQASRSGAKISHLLKITPLAYPVVISVFLYPMMLRQFTNSMTDFITVRYGIAFIEAKNLSAFLQITRAIFALIASALMTKYGKRSLGLLLSPILHLAAQLVFTVLPAEGQTSIWVLYLTVLTIAIGDAIFCCCGWSSFMTCCPSKLGQIGSAILLLLLNLNFTLMPVFLGWLTKERTVQAYTHENYFFVGLAFLCLCIGISAVYIDTRKYGGVLMKQENDEAVRKFKGSINREYEKILKGESTLSGGDGPDYLKAEGDGEKEEEEMSFELKKIDSEYKN